MRTCEIDTENDSYLLMPFTAAFPPLPSSDKPLFYLCQICQGYPSKVP